MRVGATSRNDIRASRLSHVREFVDTGEPALISRSRLVLGATPGARFGDLVVQVAFAAPTTSTYCREEGATAVAIVDDAARFGATIKGTGNVGRPEPYLDPYGRATTRPSPLASPGSVVGGA